MSEIQHSGEYLAHLQKYRAASSRLGITPEIEKVITGFLSDIGILTSCAGLAGCTGPCPNGQSCIAGPHWAECMCSSKFKMDGNRIVLRA